MRVETKENKYDKILLKKKYSLNVRIKYYKLL